MHISGSIITNFGLYSSFSHLTHTHTETHAYKSWSAGFSFSLSPSHCTISSPLTPASWGMYILYPTFFILLYFALSLRWPLPKNPICSPYLERSPPPSSDFSSTYHLHYLQLLHKTSVPSWQPTSFTSPSLIISIFYCYTSQNHTTKNQLFSNLTFHCPQLSLD